MRVLVLDDDYRDISPILRHMFPEDEFTFVDTPRSAEKELDSNAFDLVLLDGSLGLGIYGPEVLKRWR
ncbi:MAG TPA: hypothetical protein VFA15_02305, partial [Nitrososphaera sp.]|nr:hypothetical protein [Nitrososphaera sp.]